MELTPEFFAALIQTAAGATIGAAIISRGIDMFKKFGVTALDGREKLASLVGVVLLVGLAAFVVVGSNPPLVVLTDAISGIMFVASLVVAGYGMMLVALGTHDAVSHTDRSNALTNSTGWKKEE